jgi:hypothetical protein
VQSAEQHVKSRVYQFELLESVCSTALQPMPTGLLPPRLGTLQRQVDRYWAAVQDCCTDLDKYQVNIA